jgi:MFS family permease
MRATSFEMTALGAMLWGLQMAVTQGLLAASVADAAPPELRGTAFGIYELAIGLMAFAANVAAGALWVVGGAPLTFAAGGCAGAAAIVALLIGRPR